MVDGKGAVVEHGPRFAPGACEVVGSNPTGPTIYILLDEPATLLLHLFEEL
jgi:hypothetical protein